MSTRLDPDPLTVWPEGDPGPLPLSRRSGLDPAVLGLLLAAALSGALVGFVLGVAVGRWT